MGLFTRDIKTMNDLFLHQLQDIYYAEKQLVKALPKMADKATRQAAQAGLFDPSRGNQNARAAPRGGVPDVGAEVKAVDCPAIDGIIEEAERLPAKSPTNRCWTRP